MARADFCPALTCIEHGAVTASRDEPERPPVCRSVATVSEGFAHSDCSSSLCSPPCLSPVLSAVEDERAPFVFLDTGQIHRLRTTLMYLPTLPDTAGRPGWKADSSQGTPNSCPLTSHSQPGVLLTVAPTASKDLEIVPSTHEGPEQGHCQL